MKLNNKGFSMVELLAVVALLGILVSIAVFGVSRYKTKAINDDYEALAKSSYNAMQEYVMANPYETEANIEKLEEQRFLSNRRDPASKDANCEGAVIYESKDGTNGSMDEGKYTVYLCCSSHKKKYTYPGGKVENITDDTYCDISSEPEPPTPTTTTYTLKYDDNGGSGCSSKSITKNANQKWGTLCTPTRSNYKFTGWKNGTETITANSLATGNITVKASWVINSVTTYKCAAGKYLPKNKTTCATCTAGNYCPGGEWPKSTSKDQGLEKCSTKAPGYSYSIEGSKKITDCYMKVSAGYYVKEKEDKTPNKCAKGKYKVAHEVKYNSVSTCTNCPSGYREGPGTTKKANCIMKVGENKYVKKAEDPSPTNCPKGKYKNPHEVKFGKRSSCDSKTIEVTFNCNGGTRSSGSEKVTYYSDKVDQKFSTTCKRSGHTQDGWKKNKNGSKIDYATNSAVSENFVLNNEPKITIYAHWKENKKYTINLKKGTGISSVSLDGSTTTLTKTVAAGTKVNIDATKADFYSFSKWSDGNTNKSRTIIVNSNLNLTAEATENTLVVKYHTNGGTLGAGKHQFCPQSINCSKTICTDFSTNSPYCTGNKTGIVYISEKMPFNSTALSNYGLCAYHHKDYASLYTVNSGYKTTDNWLVGSNKSTIKIDEDTNFPKVRDLAKAMKKEEDLKKGSIEVTVYEEWLKNVYTIEYSLDGGTISPTNPTTYTSTTETFTLRNPTKSGYTFLGWTTTFGGPNPKTTVTIPKGSTGDKLFYANWKANSKKYTIKVTKGTGISTVKLNGKTSPLSLTVEAGTKVTIDATPADYYSFSKWSDGNTTKSRTITVNSDITYTATGRKNKVIINYYRNGGTIVTSDPKQKGKNADPCYTSSGDYDNTSSMQYGLLDYKDGGGLTMTRSGYEARGRWIVGSPTGSKKLDEDDDTFDSRKDFAIDCGKTENEIKSGDVTINVYAEWRKYACTITYNPNGGTFNSKSRVHKVYYGDDVTLRLPSYYGADRDWYHTLNASAWTTGTKTYDATKTYKAQNLCSGLANEDKNLILKVDWKKNKLTFNVYTNGGELIAGPKQICPNSVKKRDGKCDGCNVTTNYTGCTGEYSGKVYSTSLTFDNTGLADGGLRDHKGINATLRMRKNNKTATDYWHVHTKNGKKISENKKYATIKSFVADANVDRTDELKNGNITVNIYADWK